VISALNGVKALEIFQKASKAFDLVITDQTMPEMTGIELTKEIHLVRDDIPIILCTGFNEKITEENTRYLGIGALIGKPVRVAKIAEVIREVLDKNS
jgi:CheY-like chemotaxis protein